MIKFIEYVLKTEDGNEVKYFTYTQEYLDSLND